ncbi:uncharacterized protein A4U43_C05F3670 [Asparagus officinalis]|uniref:Uncharacterized protein n=1 Tax=Asparagus officinalis TaxID=4686 RepID=A0A5P1EP34_ASPOF|nr:uncharacterized protein A4U43_C05F3670 [Asparagus officinalis]
MPDPPTCIVWPVGQDTAARGFRCHASPSAGTGRPLPSPRRRRPGQPFTAGSSTTATVAWVAHRVGAVAARAPSADHRPHSPPATARPATWANPATRVHRHRRPSRHSTSRAATFRPSRSVRLRYISRGYPAGSPIHCRFVRRPVGRPAHHGHRRGRRCPLSAI